MEYSCALSPCSWFHRTTLWTAHKAREMSAYHGIRTTLQCWEKNVAEFLWIEETISCTIPRGVHCRCVGQVCKKWEREREREKDRIEKEQPTNGWYSEWELFVFVFFFYFFSASSSFYAFVDSKTKMLRSQECICSVDYFPFVLAAPGCSYQNTNT